MEEFRVIDIDMIFCDYQQILFCEKTNVKNGKKFIAVMEAESSLPCSQEPPTGPFSEPPYFPKIRFNIILPPKPTSSKCFFPSGF
jgi:hypothetical protein